MPIGSSVATVVVSKWSGEFTEQTAVAEYSRVFGRKEMSPCFPNISGAYPLPGS
jgi:hypothetical protein